MLFNSNQFVLFFGVILVLYYLLEHRYRKYLLLVGSYYFYMKWNSSYAALILLTTAVVFVTARLMDGRPIKFKKKMVWVSLVVNLTILFIFKYFNFFADIFNSVAPLISSGSQMTFINVLLPVGISFYTFQALSYTLDVYRGQIAAEKDFFVFALYISFFPQLVAGPIERSTHLLPQFYNRVRFNYGAIRDGLQLMLWGFFQKMVVADNLSIYVNEVFNNPAKYDGKNLLLATYFFSVQIYCDFSGYTDIARGAAKVLGFDLMKNFRFPYFSNSIQDFWRRWHISLSSWFRDYLYVPLGGNRVSTLRWAFNISTVFLLTGVWHGALMTFLFWGALHGSFILREKFFPLTFAKKSTFYASSKLVNLLKSWTSVFVTFQLVCFTWIFFRANSMKDAVYIVKNIFNFNSQKVLEVYTSGQILIVYTCLSIFLAFHCLAYFRRNAIVKLNDIFVVRHIAYVALILSILFFSGAPKIEQFIYFQF